MLGIEIDPRRIEIEVDKIRKTLNLMCNTHPLFSVNETMLNQD